MVGCTKQQNNFDCGVFTMWYMQKLSEREPPTKTVSNLLFISLYNFANCLGPFHLYYTVDTLNIDLRARHTTTISDSACWTP